MTEFGEQIKKNFYFIKFNSQISVASLGMETLYCFNHFGTELWHWYVWKCHMMWNFIVGDQYDLAWFDTFIMKLVIRLSYMLSHE